ncbi:hypothetical protein ACFRCI_31295 [Streptomyces sp. NPDC056638]|uniref:hypothetical protein n=1 Tax=Streptomyces sp. NPDC056638 TaxID=3345887 RepID=UPI00368484C5
MRHEHDGQVKVCRSNPGIQPHSVPPGPVGNGRPRRTYWELIARADRTPVPTKGGALSGGAIRSEYGAFVHAATVTPWIVALKAAAAGGPPAPATPTASVVPDSVPVRSADAGAGAFGADVPADNPSAVVWAGPSCADAGVTRYLTTGRLPAKDLTCGG